MASVRIWVVDIDQRLRLVTSEAIPEIGVVCLVPARGRGSLPSPIASIARDLAVGLAGHSALIPAASSRIRSYMMLFSHIP